MSYLYKEVEGLDFEFWKFILNCHSVFCKEGEEMCGLWKKNVSSHSVFWKVCGKCTFPFSKNYSMAPSLILGKWWEGNMCIFLLIEGPILVWTCHGVSCVSGLVHAIKFQVAHRQTNGKTTCGSASLALTIAVFQKHSQHAVLTWK